MKQKFNSFAAICGAILISASSVAIPAFAATSADLGVSAPPIASGTVIGHVGLGSTTRSGNITAARANLITKAGNAANQEITRRITALNALSTRVNAMVKLSADEKSTISASIQSQITLMNNLQAQITADINSGATSSLKMDIQSITKSYRIFALILPQGTIEAAVDRILDIAGILSDLSTKLQARISAAPSTTNVSGAQGALTDMNAKVADAIAQANAANSEIAPLVPDNGDATIMKSNTAALKDARSKIQAAQKDLTAAQKDANTIAKDLRVQTVNTATTTAVSASTSANVSQ